MKKHLFILSFIFVLFALVSCTNKNNNSNNNQNNNSITFTAYEKESLSAKGYVDGYISDFTQYVDTTYYRKVKNASEFIKAIYDSKWSYTNNWDSETNTYTQTLNKEGSVRVIEITKDIELGYNQFNLGSETSNFFGDEIKVVANYVKNNSNTFVSDIVNDYGISEIKMENIRDLLIYSKTGAKITHAGFSLLSCDNIVFRNISFDELWQWEDGNNDAQIKMGDYDAQKWTYMKINHCGHIWVDHCEFGKSYDGQIDVANPDYSSTKSTSFRAPYMADGTTGVHISNCRFNAGDPSEDGYIYKMMLKLEEDFKANGFAKAKYKYYAALRTFGLTFEQVLYGFAIPQKKGFLLGDKGSVEEYYFNEKLSVSFQNCYFKDLEDRLPKLRGGNVHMTNCVVDSSNYYSYRQICTGLSLKSKMESAGYKCGLVSQGIICGNGGSVYAEACVFKGIETILKNNDAISSNPASDLDVSGGFKLVNCSYQKASTDTVYIGSSDDANSVFKNILNPGSGANLTKEYFKFHTIDGSNPFTPTLLNLSELEDHLLNSRFKPGLNNELKDLFLISNYK